MWQVQLDSDPWPRNSICCRKERKKERKEERKKEKEALCKINIVKSVSSHSLMKHRRQRGSIKSDQRPEKRLWRRSQCDGIQDFSSAPADARTPRNRIFQVLREKNVSPKQVQNGRSFQNQAELKNYCGKRLEALTTHSHSVTERPQYVLSHKEITARKGKKNKFRKQRHTK